MFVWDRNLENSIFGALTFFSPFCVISWDVFLRRQFGKVFQNWVTKKHIKTKINSLQRPKNMGDEESTLGGYHEYRGGQYFWIIGNPLMWAEHYSFHNLTPLFMLQIFLTPPSLNLKWEMAISRQSSPVVFPGCHQMWVPKISSIIREEFFGTGKAMVSILFN